MDRYCWTGITILGWTNWHVLSPSKDQRNNYNEISFLSHIFAIYICLHIQMCTFNNLIHHFFYRNFKRRMQDQSILFWGFRLVEINMTFLMRQCQLTWIQCSHYTGTHNFANCKMVSNPHWCTPELLKNDSSRLVGPEMFNSYNSRDTPACLKIALFNAYQTFQMVANFSIEAWDVKPLHKFFDKTTPSTI